VLIRNKECNNDVQLQIMTFHDEMTKSMIINVHDTFTIYLSLSTYALLTLIMTEDHAGRCTKLSTYV